MSMSGSENIGVVTALFKIRGIATVDPVLLVKRGKQPNLGLWALPGGRLRAGEKLYEGAIRELREETGIADHECKLLPHPVETTLVRVKGGPAWELHVFAGLQLASKDPTASDDAAEVAFCSAADLNLLPTVDGLQKVVEKARQAVENSLKE